MSHRRARCGWSLAVAAAVVVVDQLTKEWALDALADTPIDVIWTLRFNLAFNKGMAFSQGSGLGPIIGVVALCVIVGLLVSVGRSSSRLYPVAVGLITGGAVGNLLDRLFRVPGWLEARSSTSSTCSGGRSSTWPTSASRSVARCCCSPASGAAERADPDGETGPQPTDVGSTAGASSWSGSRRRSPVSASTGSSP